MTSQFQVLNKILQNKDYSFITLNNLTVDYFFNYKAEYEFIKTHYDMYHVVPDRLTFLNSFPNFTIQDVNEPDNYLVEQLYNDYNQSYLATRLNNLKKLLEADDTAGAMKYFQESLEKLFNQIIIRLIYILNNKLRKVLKESQTIRNSVIVIIMSLDKLIFCLVAVKMLRSKVI